MLFAEVSKGGNMKMLFMLIIILFALASQPEPTITTRWIDAQRIEICASRPGALYVGGAGAYIGEIEAGCRVFPPANWELIDAVYAPEAGKVYCLATTDATVCAKPLPRPKRYKVHLPVAAR